MSMPPDHVRLFVACEVPEDVRESIGTIIETLRNRSGSASHLCLASFRVT